MSIADFLIALKLLSILLGGTVFFWSVGGIWITDLKNRWRLKMLRKKWKN